MNKINYSTILLQQKRQVFHTQDLRVLWGIRNNNTLYTTVKRYVDRGILFPVQKGLFTTVSTQQLDPWVLGLAALHGFGYISCESILAQNGLISQVTQSISLVGTKTKNFSIASYRFSVRQLQDDFLYQPFGISMLNGIRQANMERAIADQLYFQPHFNFDVEIDWPLIREVQTIIGYPITKRL